MPRHIGPSEETQAAMLEALNYPDMDSFIDAVVPANILTRPAMQLPSVVGETAALAELKAVASQNVVNRSFIGQGYYGCHTPHVILRNILENPAWYTAYTPYQPEISQGRLEALLNFQTLITDLTGMDMASSSLLDEGTAAAEAMALCKRMGKSKGNIFWVDQHCLPQTIEVVRTRAEAIGFELVVGDPNQPLPSGVFGALLQYPGVDGEIRDFSEIIDAVHEQAGLAVMACDILSLLLLKSPAELGADVAIGSTQRFGVPFGFGGPHAAYMATREAFKRSLPGRLVGVSIDSTGKPAYRLALQTREQHIRREKATSNICTAQVLLAVMASMYALYHGPAGLRKIAQRTHLLTTALQRGLAVEGFATTNQQWFDTLTVETGIETDVIHARARSAGINLREIDSNTLGISLDETSSEADVRELLGLFGCAHAAELQLTAALTGAALRSDAVLTHPVFNRYHSETEMLRYLRKLADRDIALDRAMIPLGSCTMKLNATAEMIPVTWPEFGQIHPFAPADQVAGYHAMINQLEEMLCDITGYDAMSLQPNAGSQGEYAGLLAIRGYHHAHGDQHRNICLIPSSAHGTNPASAQMCGMKVVVVKCDSDGNVDLDDLRAKAEQHSDNLSAIMITYPSTHGVFEAAVSEVCAIVHDHGGQVYIDGANFNAMVGLCQPGKFGGDVSHLNLHKTFCIPHGGGGPGVGPIGVKSHLAPFLPGHDVSGLEGGVGAVSAAAWGSASILPITWMYIRMMGERGLRHATEVAILSANYIAAKLEGSYPVLYTGGNGRVAHECIIDIRPITERTGVTVDDIAKRLIDFGFHAPTMSFPVAGTLMIEPTESESLVELDRFIDALLKIRAEIAAVEAGELTADQSPLHFAPHTAEVLLDENWQRSYSRTQGAYPAEYLRDHKYWPPVGRIDNVHGDRQLVCSCPPLSDYE
ncbi:MAG: aminomethyl-transferring glycine dehydrogenase [Porticoccaceae bacterium]